MFEVTEFDPDEVFEFIPFMEAEFLGLPYSSFRESAPHSASARYYVGEVWVFAAGAFGVGPGTISFWDGTSYWSMIERSVVCSSVSVPEISSLSCAAAKRLR